MATSARLRELRELIQADIDALPNRDVRSADAEQSNTDGEGERGAVVSPPQSPVGVYGTQHVLNDTELGSEVANSVGETSIETCAVWIKGAESSYNPNAQSLQKPIKPVRLACTLSENPPLRGELTAIGHCFTPIGALAKYPYKYCDKAHMQAVASAFFDQGKFWEYTWDLYYVWGIKPPAEKPTILIHDSQVQTLLDKINSELDLQLRVTDAQREEAFVASFPEHPRCRPRYLGRSRCRADYDSLVESTPNSMFHAANEPAEKPLQSESLEDFKRLMEEIADVQKANNKASKVRKQQDRLMKQKSMADQFKRAQRYLGLRPSVTLLPGPPEAIDPALRTTSNFDQDVVFVCIDVESWEMNHGMITEVGIATLDTRDLLNAAPGPNGKDWRKMVQARHFLIKEHRHRVNRKFVSGCPDQFSFGTSEVISLADVVGQVASCFQEPFCAPKANNFEDTVSKMTQSKGAETRKIVFLGHDTMSDVRYLQKLGFDPLKQGNILEALDTSVLYRAWRREQQTTSLGKILASFDITGWFLHNAGNDAVYTLQAMLAMCVREATIRGTPELNAMRLAEKTARLASNAQEAKQRAQDDTEGWSDNEALGDGGDPVALRADSPPAASVERPSAGYGSGHGPGHRRDKGRGRGNGNGNGNRQSGSHNRAQYKNGGQDRGQYRGQYRGHPGRGQGSREGSNQTMW